MSKPPRAPRLTGRLLEEDLPLLVVLAGEELDYLRSRLEDSGAGVLAEKLEPVLETRVARLTRARDWLAGKIAAESAHRSDDEEDFLP